MLIETPVPFITTGNKRQIGPHFLYEAKRGGCANAGIYHVGRSSGPLSVALAITWFALLTEPTNGKVINRSAGSAPDEEVRRLRKEAQDHPVLSASD
jgi:hypothetical protein